MDRAECAETVIDLQLLEIERLRAELAAERRRADILSKDFDRDIKNGFAEREKLRAELAAEREECLEQARLNGMGAERELKLMTERDALCALLREARDTLRMAEGYGQASFYRFIARIDAALKGDGDE